MAIRIWAGNDATPPYDWSVTGNWQGGTVPVSTDDVYIPAGSAKITAGLNQSAVSLSSLTIQEGYDQDIGSATGYLQIGTSSLVVDSSGGQQFINLGSSSVSPEIRGTGTAGTGERALNLLGSAIATLSVNAGSVGVAIAGDETSTVTTARVLTGNLLLGSGVTLTTLYQRGGSVDQRCASTTSELQGGTLETSNSGTMTTANVYGGTLISNSSGTVTTLNAYGGSVDFNQSSVARTVTTLNIYANDPVTLMVDEEYMTITNYNEPTGVPFSATYSRAV